uniref:Transmembrane protein n=1 Tax=Bursaphelenchus xylophilus TaxID=6326 RepID=A0A1I7SX39_BURXY
MEMDREDQNSSKLDSLSMSSIPDSDCSPSDCSKTSSSVYSNDWPQKSSIISTTVSSTSSATSNRKPDGKMKIKTLCLLGALLPGIGCYFCVCYTYLFQFDRVLNFTSTNCPDVMSIFPPISYSIGVWKPQKYVWLIVMALHMPPRFLYGLAYKNQYTYGQSTHKQLWWFDWLVKFHLRLMIIESMGLILVSVIDIESSFIIHAASYALWITCLNFNMLFNTILQHYSGIKELTENHKTTFYIKCTLFAFAYPLSVSTGFSYGTYLAYCNGFVSQICAIGESSGHREGIADLGAEGLLYGDPCAP